MVPTTMQTPHPCRPGSRGPTRHALQLRARRAGAARPPGGPLRLGEQLDKSSSVPRPSLRPPFTTSQDRHAPCANVHDRYAFRQVLTLDGALRLNFGTTAACTTIEACTLRANLPPHTNSAHDAIDRARASGFRPRVRVCQYCMDTFPASASAHTASLLTYMDVHRPWRSLATISPIISLARPQALQTASCSASLLPTRSRFANATVSESATNEHTGDALVETVPSDGDGLTFADHELLERERPTTTSPECFDNNAPVTTFPRPAGGVPRHVGMSNNRLYTLHELGSALSVQAMPTAPDGISSTISISIIPANLPPALSGPPQRSSSRRPVPASVGTFVSSRNTGVQTSTGVSFAIFENVGQGTPEEKL